MRTGEAIDAGAKVYGFRVDNVHSEAYRMLNGMCRNAIDQELEIIDGEEGSEDPDGLREPAEEKKKKRVLRLGQTHAGGERTLEREANLNVASFDTQHEVDPLFRKTTQKFDEMGLSTLMSSTLNATPGLLLQLDSHMSSIGKIKDQEKHRRQSGQNAEETREARQLNKSYTQNVPAKFDLNAIR